MSDMKPVERALRILLRLSTHGRVTVRELYDLFDRRESIRSIQRSLETIQAANIPLTINRGPHNEHQYSLRRAFDYLPQLLETEEMLAAMLLAPFISFFEGTRLGKDIEQVFRKIDHLVPPGSIAFSSALHGLGDTFLWQEPGRVKFKGGDDYPSTLMRAVIEHRLCRVSYVARGETAAKEFSIRPYTLLFHTGGIYVIVNVPPYENFIYLAAQRIRTLELLDDVFERDPSFNLQEYLEHNFGIWRDPPVDVVLHFNRDAAQSIEERVWHPSQRIEHLEDQSVLLKLHVGLSEEFIAWILRWGHNVEVLEPDSFRDLLRARLETTLKFYQ